MKKVRPKSVRMTLYSSACRRLSPGLIMVTGCQRSGTTLVFMMLAAHGRVRGYDESETGFSFPSWRLLLRNRLAGLRTCIKHPMATPYVQWMASEFPQARNVFVVRHPCSVVSSMRNLAIYEGSNWLQRHARHELARHRTAFPEIDALKPDTLDDVRAGAYVWRYKQRMIDIFRQRGLQVHVVRYETLLEDPGSAMRGLVEDLGLPWDDRVLHHETSFQRTVYAGGTRGDRPLDRSRREPAWNLSGEEVETVTSVCGDEMKAYGYVD